MIVQAAVRRGETIFAGRRHSDCIYQAIRQGWEPPVLQSEQGFLDDQGKHYTRSEALIEALKCGQVSKDRLPVMLTSEELW